MSVNRLGMAAALSLLFAASLDAQAMRIGYINTQEVLAQYPPAQAALERLQEAETRWNNELQLLRSDLDQAIAEFRQQQGTMTPEALQARDGELTARARAIEARQGQIQEESQQLQDDLVRPIMDQISAVIEEVRVEGNYAIILDAGAPVQVILAADESLNLTQAVLTKLEEKGAPGGGR